MTNAQNKDDEAQNRQGHNYAGIPKINLLDSVASVGVDAAMLAGLEAVTCDGVTILTKPDDKRAVLAPPHVWYKHLDRADEATRTYCKVHDEVRARYAARGLRVV